MFGFPEILAAADGASSIFAVLALTLALAVVVSLLLLRFRQSLLVGYLVCGVLIGNFGTGLAPGLDKHSPVIGQLSEMGVILLMFTLGIGFSLGELRHLWRVAVFGGGPQVLATGALAGGVAAVCGCPLAECVLIGSAVAVSSTAVAMKTLQDMGKYHDPGARTTLGVLLFQDLFVIVLFLVLPVVFSAGSAGAVVARLGVALLKAVAFLCGAWLLGHYGITRLLHMVARTGSRELFTLTVIGLCAGVAFAGHALDLSLALGAFTAGLVVSESMYNHRIFSEILPFKDLFLAIFFIAVGLMVDLGEIAAAWPRILGLTAVILAAKAVIAFAVLKCLRLPGRTALSAAAGLSGMGEFSLVLLGNTRLPVPPDPALQQTLLACTAITMAVVPALMRGSWPLGRRLERAGVFKAHQLPPVSLNPSHDLKNITDHAVICGYGPVGQALNEALKRSGLQTLVIDLNAQTVRSLLTSGQLTVFADASHPEALDLAGIDRARLIAFTFPEVESTSAAVPLVRQRNPGILILARAKFSAEVARLREFGVEVIHDERESAVAMVRAAMDVCDRPDIVPEDIVGDAVKKG